MFPRRKAILLEYRNSNFSTYAYRSAQKHIKILQNIPKHDLTRNIQPWNFIRSQILWHFHYVPAKISKCLQTTSKMFPTTENIEHIIKILQQVFTCSEEQYKACLYVQLQQFQIGFQKQAHSCKQGPQQILLLLAVQPQSSLSWKTGNLKTPDQYIGWPKSDYWPIKQC